MLLFNTSCPPPQPRQIYRGREAFFSAGSFCFPDMLHPPPAGQGVWPQSCSPHPSRAQWDPAGCCSSKGSLALPLLFLHLSIHPQDLAAMPWVFPDIDTQGTSVLKKICPEPLSCKPGRLSKVLQRQVWILSEQTCFRVARAAVDCIGKEDFF